MTNKTRELLELADNEPLVVEDFVLMLRDMDEDEIGHVEQVAHNLLEAIGRIDQPTESELYGSEGVNL